MDSSANNLLIVIKRESLANRSNGPPVATAVVKCSVPSGKTAQSRNAIATLVEYVLLIVVGSIVVAAILPVIEQGVIDLIKRVGQLLASGR